MSFADCNSCSRHHKRPVNSRCEYSKAAVSKCAELGISSSEYVKFLLELLFEDMEPVRAVPISTSTPGRACVPSSSGCKDELLQQLITENAKCRKLLESSQNQVERMMTQLLDLKVNSQKQSSSPVPSDGATVTTTQAGLSGAAQGAQATVSSSPIQTPINMNIAQTGVPPAYCSPCIGTINHPLYCQGNRPPKLMPCLLFHLPYYLL